MVKCKWSCWRTSWRLGLNCSCICAIITILSKRLMAIFVLCKMVRFKFDYYLKSVCWWYTLHSFWACVVFRTVFYSLYSTWLNLVTGTFPCHRDMLESVHSLVRGEFKGFQSKGFGSSYVFQSNKELCKWQTRASNETSCLFSIRLERFQWASGKDTDVEM